MHHLSKKLGTFSEISKKTYNRDLNNCVYSCQFQLDRKFFEFFYGRSFKGESSERPLSVWCCTSNFLFYYSHLRCLSVPNLFGLLCAAKKERSARTTVRSLIQTQISCVLGLHDRLPSTFNPSDPHFHHNPYPLLVRANP